MGAQISEEIKTFFVGDSAGLVNAMKEVNAALKGNEALEAKVARSIRSIREQQVKDTALAPIRAVMAERRAADARVKLAKDTADKLIRQQKASSTSNLVKELRGNFGANAKKKIGGALENTLGLSEDAAEGLVARVSGLATGMAAAAAVGTVLYKGFKVVETQIVADTGKMADLSAEMQRASRINMFSSSAESADSLIAKLTQSTELIKKNKELHRELNPYGFGTGFAGTAKTMAIKPFQATYDFFNDGPFAKHKREQENLRLNTGIQKGLARNERNELTESYRRQNNLIMEGLRGSAGQLKVMELQAAKEREILALKGTPAATPANYKAIEDQYAPQIEAVKELDTFRDRQFARDSATLGISRQLVTEETKRVRLIEMEVAAQDDIIKNRQFKTDEERQAALIQRGQKVNELRTARPDAKIADLRFGLATRSANIAFSGGTDEQKRLATRQGELSELFKEYGLVQRIDVTRARGIAINIAAKAQEVRLDRASFSVAESQFHLAEQTARMRSTNLSDDVKRYQIAEDTVQSLREQYAALKGIDETKARTVALAGADAEEDIRQQRLHRGYGKTDSQIMQKINRERLSTIKKNRWEQAHPDGLMSIHRDMNGRILDGIDMMTGQRRGLSKSFLANGGRNPLMDTGHDTDTAKGNTLLSAARAQVDAIDVSNAYLKQMQMDISMMSSNWGFA